MSTLSSLALRRLSIIAGNCAFLLLIYCCLGYFLEGHEDGAFHLKAFSQDSLYTVANLAFRNSLQNYLKLDRSGVGVELLVLDVLQG